MRTTTRLRQLLAEPNMIVAPGAYDALSARLIAQSGFPAVYMTGFGTTASVLGQPDVGLLTLQIERFNLGELVQEVVAIIQQTTQSHRLILEHLQKIQIVADKDRIEQVMINLLTNAIKYSPHADRVVIRVFADAEEACVSVQDFGIGIQESEQEKIFERFYQSPTPLEQTYPGLGMGLYISSEIIARHYGKITVSSRKGEGSTFSLALPLREDGV